MNTTIIAAATLTFFALAILHVSHNLKRSFKIMSVATDALTAALAGLTTSVNALIAANALPKENTAAIQASTDAVTALKGTVDTALAAPTA